LAVGGVFRWLRKLQHIHDLVNKSQEALLILLYLNPDDFSSIIKPVNIILVYMGLGRSIATLVS
jgi:hypothetical protein